MNGPASITVAIAEGDEQFLGQLEDWLANEPTIEVVGSVHDGDSAVALARRAKPDVVLMDMDMPGRSGIDATEMITTLLPGTGVILISTDGAPDSLRKAMIAGARQFVLKNTTKQEVVRTIREVHQSTVARRVLGGPAVSEAPRGPSSAKDSAARRQGEIVAVFSPKGGVGSTTVAVNVAAVLRKDHNLQVALVDGSLPFGDIAVFLDMAPNRSIMDLVVNPEQIDDEDGSGALSTHQSTGLKVLLAPPRPEMAEMVTADQLRRSLSLLKESFEFTIVDTWSCLDERVLTILEIADRILLCFTLDLPAIKSAKVFLEVSELLRFPPEKITTVLIKSTGTQGIEVRDVEATMGRPVGAQISHDSRTTSRCINEGSPVVLGQPGTIVAADFRKLAGLLLTEEQEALAKTKKLGRFGLFAKS
ncbi:MAG: response regulator receiver protein [Chloroflexi bacterium]|nr:response regulator receiver protein [Chloroflexota bacterium]